MKLTVPSRGSMTQQLPLDPSRRDPSSASSESSGRAERIRSTMNRSAARSASVTMSVGEDFRVWPVGRASSRRRPAPWASSTAKARREAASPATASPELAGVATLEEGQHDLAPRVVDVGVHQGDALPGAERHPAPEHREGEGRGDERRQEVVRAVAGRAVVVDVRMLAGEEELETLDEVGLAPGAELHQDQARRGVGDGDVDEPVTLAPEEGGHLAGQVDDAGPVAGGQPDPGALHRPGVYATRPNGPLQIRGLALHPRERVTGSRCPAPPPSSTGGPELERRRREAGAFDASSKWFPLGRLKNVFREDPAL